MLTTGNSWFENDATGIEKILGTSALVATIAPQFVPLSVSGLRSVAESSRPVVKVPRHQVRIVAVSEEPPTQCRRTVSASPAPLRPLHPAPSSQPLPPLLARLMPPPRHGGAPTWRRLWALEHAKLVTDRRSTRSALGGGVGKCGLSLHFSPVGQAFRPAGWTGFPARRTNWGQESLPNRQLGKAALPNPLWSPPPAPTTGRGLQPSTVEDYPPPAPRATALPRPGLELRRAEGYPSWVPRATALRPQYPTLPAQPGSPSSPARAHPLGPLALPLSAVPASPPTGGGSTPDR